MLPGGRHLVLHGPSGGSDRFVLESSGSFVPEEPGTDVEFERIVPLGNGEIEVQITGGGLQIYRTGETDRLYLLAEMVARNGAWLGFEWEEDRLLRVLNSDGEFVEVVRGRPRNHRPADWEGAPRITEIRDSAGRAVRFRYDAKGRLVLSEAPSGILTHWEYDAEGRLAGAYDQTGSLVFRAEYGAGEWFRITERAGGPVLSPSRGFQAGMPLGTPPSTESIDPIGGDPPPYQECGPDAYGYCDASCSNPQCWGGIGGGGGGGGNPGGGGEPCSLSIMPTSAVIDVGEWVSFSATASGCSTPQWSAPASSQESGQGSSFSTSYGSPGAYVVSVSADGIMRSAQVDVLPPPCTYGVDVSPGSAYIGEPVTFSITGGTCSEYSWSVGGAACPTEGDGTSWVTRFRQAGPRPVTVTGSTASYVLATSFNVPILACSVSVSGPSSSEVGQTICYSASVAGGTSGTYTWTSAGGIPSTQVGPDPTFCTVFTQPGTFSVAAGFDKDVTGCASVACAGATTQVTVSPPPPPTVQINAADQHPLLKTATAVVTATGLDGFGNPASGAYAWVASDPSVIALTPNGPQVGISGLSPGSSALSVTLTTADGSDSDQIMVHVSELAVVGITTAEADPFLRRSYDLASLYLAEADPMIVIATIIPDLPVDVTATGSVDPSGAGSFDPPSVSGQNQLSSTFTAEPIDVPTGATPIYLGYAASDGTVVDQVPAILTEQELVRMVYGEGACRPTRERAGLAWVARNRVGDAGFDAPPGNDSLFEVIRQSRQFAGYWLQETLVRADLLDDPSRAAYDGITDEGGLVQQGLSVDLTLGSVGFVTPEDQDILALLSAFDSNETVDAQDLVVQSPGFLGDYQAVLVQPRPVYESAAAGAGVCENPFVFFRRKQAGDPTVAFNP